jgi:hypothetical protein
MSKFSLLILFSIISLTFGAAPPYGKLSLSNAQLVGSNGQAVQLRGMSFYWSQWDSPDYWTAAVVKALACNWNANVVSIFWGNYYFKYTKLYFKYQKLFG